MFSNQKQITANRSSGPMLVITLSALLSTGFSPAFVSASEESQSTLDESINPESASAVAKFHRAENTVNTGKYIVVLKQDKQDDLVHKMTANSSSVYSEEAMKAFRREALETKTYELSSYYGVEVEQRYYSAISGFLALTDEQSAIALSQHEDVAFVEEDQLMHANTTQRNATWGLDRIDQANLPLDSQYTYDFDGSGVDAYILDTGILASHENFDDRVTGGYTSIRDGQGTSDCNGHGTHVAGTVGGRTWGVAKNVNLIPVRVLGCEGSGPNSGVIAGVDWVAENASGPSVANMSLGGGASSALDAAIRRAVNAGVTFVAAAGNSNSDACGGSPSRVPQAITVANSTSRDTRAGSSSWGRCVDIFAPGTRITSAWSNGRTATISGTSMAAPHVAGVAALYLDYDPSASPADVTEAIESSAVSGRISDPQGSPNLLLQTTFFTGPTPTPTPAPDCVGGALDLREVTDYGAGSSGGFDVSENGCSITLDGNIWRMTESNFTITADTVITFDFSAVGSGEIQGVGFDDDAEASEDRIFKLAGSQDWGVDGFEYSGAGELQSMTIPVGQYYTGSNLSFVIANDNDEGVQNNSVVVSNVIISSGATPTPAPTPTPTLTPTPVPTPSPTTAPNPIACVDGAVNLQNTDNYSSSSPGEINIDANGCTAYLTGNVWKITTQGYTITENTVVEFDFATNGTGEIQGIGFDEDGEASSDRIFRLAGSQDWGIGDFSYSGNGNLQSMRIPVGQFYTGANLGLVLANDKDDGDQDNTITLSNLVIREANSSTPTPQPTPTATPTPPNFDAGFYFIEHKPTSDRMHSCAQEDRSPIGSRADTHDGECVQWERIENGEYFYLRSRVSGKNVMPDSDQNGSPISIVPSEWLGNWAQWHYLDRGDGHGHLQHRGTGKFIFLGGESNGMITLQPSSWRGDYTRWRFVAAD